jgi:hypothetical protein
MNEATARQDGNRNESTQTQRFDKNTALVNQDGCNKIKRTLTNMAEGSEAIIRQKIQQSRANAKGEDNYAKTTQDGNHNSA